MLTFLIIVVSVVCACVLIFMLNIMALGYMHGYLRRKPTTFGENAATTADVDKLRKQLVETIKRLEKNNE